jgi:predicted esterase
MKKFIMTALLSILAAGMNQAEAQISPDGTYLFEERDTCSLFLDVYNPARGSQTSIDGVKKPTIIFMFGGGFIQGTRDNDTYKEWFKLMTKNGYRIISIDYRLGLKGTDKVGVAQVNILDKAIHMAVEDLFKATSYIVDNADALGVDPTNIVISGSSAGAISVLQAEYELSNGTPYTHILPAGFRYAGVMSFAGAILSRKGKLKFATDPAPMLLLHGTKDNIVTYKQIRFFKLGFFGSSAIAKRLSKFKHNYRIYRYLGHSHEIAGVMDSTTEMQFEFLERNVMQNKKEIVDSVIDDSTIPKWVGTLDDMYSGQKKD